MLAIFDVPAHAAAGNLDPNFSGDRKTMTDIAGDGHLGRGGAVQSDGKIVVAGVADPLGAEADDFGLARYKPNGALDPTFSTDGSRRQTCSPTASTMPVTLPFSRTARSSPRG